MGVGTGFEEKGTLILMFYQFDNDNNIHTYIHECVFVHVCMEPFLSNCVDQELVKE